MQEQRISSSNTERIMANEDLTIIEENTGTFQNSITAKLNGKDPEATMNGHSKDNDTGQNMLSELVSGSGAPQC